MDLDVTDLALDLDGDGVDDRAVHVSKGCEADPKSWRLFLKRDQCWIYVGEVVASSLRVGEAGPDGLRDLLIDGDVQRRRFNRVTLEYDYEREPTCLSYSRCQADFSWNTADIDGDGHRDLVAEDCALLSVACSAARATAVVGQSWYVYSAACRAGNEEYPWANVGSFSVDDVSESERWLYVDSEVAGAKDILWSNGHYARWTGTVYELGRLASGALPVPPMRCQRRPRGDLMEIPDVDCDGVRDLISRRSSARMAAVGGREFAAWRSNRNCWTTSHMLATPYPPEECSRRLPALADVQADAVSPDGVHQLRIDAESVVEPSGTYSCICPRVDGECSAECAVGR